MSESSRPTLATVARLAQVSKATASRVVNGGSRVSPEAKKAVEDAISRLGYVPNHAARSLTTRRAESIALVVPSVDAETMADPFCMNIAFVADQALAAEDIQLVLVTVRGPQDHARLLRYVKSGHVDGVIMLSLHGADPLPGLLHHAGVPVVVGGRPLRPTAGPAHVDVDNEEGAYRAVRHLADSGRRAIATIAGAQDMCSGIDRLAGYRRAVEEIGQAPLIAYGDYRRDRAERAMAELLERVPGLDAVYAASETMAERALRTLQRAGRRVPDDVAVIANDDFGTAENTDPPLSTVAQPVGEMARALVSLVRRKVDGEEVPDATVLPAELVLRMSC